MAKVAKKTVQPAPALPVAKPLGTPENPVAVTPAPAPAPDPNEPVPGVINPEADPTTNQPEDPIPSSQMPTGPLPPNATTVAGEEDEDDGKGKPQTAVEAINRVKDGEYGTDEDREKAMKRWPHLFAETAKN